MIPQIERRFAEIVPRVDFCSLRFVRERAEQIRVRQDVVQPVVSGESAGAMLTVCDGGGMGYAATSDLTVAGLQRAVQQALDWAQRTAGHSVVDHARIPRTPPHGEYRTPVQQPWNSLSLTNKVDLLRRECARLKVSDRIADWETSLWHNEVETLFLTTGGGRVYQMIH